MSDAKKVLIIDADPEFAEATRAILEANSIRALQATSAAEALMLAEQEEPDAIVMEAMLPDGTEGFHFTWALRQHANIKLRDVPVLLVSRINKTLPFRISYLDSDWEYSPGEFLPAQGFLDKPVDLEVLLERVRGVLGLEQSVSS